MAGYLFDASFQHLILNIVSAFPEADGKSMIHCVVKNVIHRKVLVSVKGSDDSERPSSNDKARIDFSTRILSALYLFDTWFIQSAVNEFCVIIV